MTDTLQLTRPQLEAIAALADGPCLRSNVTDRDARTVAHATVDALEAAGLAIDVAGYKAILTDRGRDVAADPPAPPPITRPHGTYACYSLDGCRCHECSWTASEYNRARAKANAVEGRSLTVDADPVRAHIETLSQAGVGLKRVAKVSGVSQGALWKLVYGSPERGRPSRTVRRTTADKIMAVTVADLAPGARVDATTTVARISDMRRAGATWREIDDRIGGSGYGNTAALATRSQVTVATARAVHQAWTDLTRGDWTPHGKRSRHDPDWTPNG